MRSEKAERESDEEKRREKAKRREMENWDRLL